MSMFKVYITLPPTHLFMSTELMNDPLSAYSLGLAIDLERDPPAIHGAHYIHLNCARLPTGGTIAQLDQMAKNRQN